MKANLEIMFWHTRRPNAGQIVEVQEPQIPGKPEGEAGPANGLTLTYDRSDCHWVLKKRGREIARGEKGTPAPSVAEAVARCKNAKDRP